MTARLVVIGESVSCFMEAGVHRAKAVANDRRNVAIIGESEKGSGYTMSTFRRPR